MLAAGLLMGGAGGAVAVADTDSSGSAAHGDDGANASAQDSATASSPVGHGTDTLRKAIQRVTSTLGSGRQPGQQPSSAKSPKKEPGSTDTKDENKDPGLLAAVPNMVAPVPDVVAPVRDVVAPVRDVVAPVRDVVASFSDVVAPVRDVVAPASDVIVAIEDMLTSAATAIVPLTQLPLDLPTLLGIAGMEPLVNVSPGVDGAGLSPAADASQSPLVLLLAGIRGVPLAGNTTDVAPLGFAASTFGATSHGMAALAPDGANPMGMQSFFRDAFNEVLIPASLAALAAAALPGVGGLMILTAAGVRIGYRQAKAGFAVQTTGIARFAKSGPLGVVRSGSLVFVRPRASRAGDLVEKAA